MYECALLTAEVGGPVISSIIGHLANNQTDREVLSVNVRNAHLRIAHWGAILRWAILSPSVIRIAHPNHETFFTLLVWFGVLATDFGWFSMLFTRLIEYTASYCSQFRVYGF